MRSVGRVLYAWESKASTGPGSKLKVHVVVGVVCEVDVVLSRDSVFVT